MDEVLSLIRAIVGSGLGVVALVGMAVTVLAFAISAQKRAQVDHAMDHGKTPLGFFDLSHGDAASAQRERGPVAPERLWTYDEEYLIHFARFARESRVPSGRPALDVYIESILLRFDLLFAVGLGTFSVAIDLAIAQVLDAEGCPNAARAACLCAGMGAIYLVADVCEDQKLAWILRGVFGRNNPNGDNVDPAQAAAANLLTRVKVI
jgi:hypothetical protein